MVDRAGPTQTNVSRDGAMSSDTAPGTSPLAADPLVGSAMSHYRLEEAVGRGGIGVVYRAKDVTLGRSVAVKVLSKSFSSSDEARARFLREARAASALDHPNIAAVLEFGEHEGQQFIAMPLYDGETLKERLERGPLEISEAASILAQIATGLDAAHRADVIHRDIKSANIFLTRNGTVKLLDFGLAKLLSDSAAQSVTKAGEAMGTLLYMSPEQLRGEPVDQRSDLWSLGVVAYEMATGVTPFQADSNAATAVRILNEEPPSLSAVPGVPTWYAALVAALLKKRPAERLQTAAEILDALEREGIAPSAPRASSSGGQRAQLSSAVSGAPLVRVLKRRWPLAVGLLAIASLAAAAFLYARTPQRATGIRALLVMPFANASPSVEMDYVSDGIAEDLINTLSEIPELQVIARTTAFRYKGKDLDLRKLGRELSIDAVLTGQVQQRGDTLLVQADLVNVRTGSELWGHRYSRQVTDIVGVQREITRDISDTLRPRLTKAVQVRQDKRFTENREAHELYLRGRFFWNKRTAPAVAKAEGYFKQAIDADPSFAAAYSGLADTYLIQGAYGYAPTSDTLQKAESAASRAIALDEELAEAHASLATIKLHQWDWSTAEKEFARALELNPNYATAHQWYSLYLRAAGRRDEAMREIKRAQQLDPASLVMAVSIGEVECMTDYQRGIKALIAASELEPASPAPYLNMAECHARWGRLQNALDEVKKGVKLEPGLADALSGSAYIYARLGRRAEAKAILEELKKRDLTRDMSGQIAAVYAGLGDKEEVFRWLEKRYQRRSVLLLNDLRESFVYDPFRSDPRFSELIRRFGFPR